MQTSGSADYFRLADDISTLGVLDDPISYFETA